MSEPTDLPIPPLKSALGMELPEPPPVVYKLEPWEEKLLQQQELLDSIDPSPPPLE